jgi:hypothetical protein
MRTIIALAVCAAMGIILACGPTCTGNEGPSLQTACAAWNGGKYEKLPKMCGINGKVGSTTVTWTDGDGTCTCTVSKEFPTLFLYVRDCSFKAGAM